MNIEELRAYCLSLSPEVEEKFPFGRFKAARDVLAFYIGGHMFCYFDINNLSQVTLKCQPERIPELQERYTCIGPPYNGHPRHWLSIDAQTADAPLLRALISNSFCLVKGQRKTFGHGK